MTSTTQQQYGVFSTHDIPQPYLIDYWTALYDANLLRHRLCDTKKPTLKDVNDMLADPTVLTFNVFDPERNELTAEFALTSFTGKAAQVHFSMHPDNKPQYSMMLAREVTDKILNEWSEQEHPDAPFLYSLFGLTPVTNRPACAFVRRVGFKKVGTLPGGQRVNGSEFVDAMITIKGRTNGR